MFKMLEDQIITEVTDFNVQHLVLHFMHELCYINKVIIIIIIIIITIIIIIRLSISEIYECRCSICLQMKSALCS